MTTTRKFIFENKHHAEFFMDCLQHAYKLKFKCELSTRHRFVVTFDVPNEQLREIETWLTGFNNGFIAGQIPNYTGPAPISPFDSSQSIEMLERLISGQ